MSLAPARRHQPRPLSLREEFAPHLSHEAWAAGCKRSFGLLTGLEPMVWSTARCVEILHKANRRLVAEFLKRTAFQLYSDDPHRIRYIGEATMAALVAAALGRDPECWGDGHEALVLVGHAARFAAPQRTTLRRLIELGATVSIDWGAGWGQEDEHQVRIWGDSESLPEPSKAERRATRRCLGI